MSRLTKADWLNVDWTKNNRQLAAELGKAYDTVARRRWALGKSGLALVTATRSDKGISKTTFIPSPEQQAKATAHARASKKAGKFETNIHAKKWRIISPDNRIFIATNLYNFVRTNATLFNPSDIIWKSSGGGEYCNATAGLLNISAGKTKSWKGWKLEKIFQ